MTGDEEILFGLYIFFNTSSRAVPRWRKEGYEIWLRDALSNISAKITTQSTGNSSEPLVNDIKSYFNGA